MLVKLTRKKPNNKISKSEYSIIKMLLDELGIEFENDFTISKEYAPVFCGDRILSFSEHYSNLNDIPKDKMIFRPLRNERHSNILIEMFEEYMSNVNIDRLEINEFVNDNNKKRYGGYFICSGDIVEYSRIKSSPSIPILKTSVIAKCLLDSDDYKVYKNLLSIYLSNEKDDNKP